MFTRFELMFAAHELISIVRELMFIDREHNFSRSKNIFLSIRQIIPLKRKKRFNLTLNYYISSSVK